MRTNRWIAAFLMMLALAAVGTCFLQIRQRNLAKRERDDAEHLSAEASAQLRELLHRRDAQKIATRTAIEGTAPNGTASGSNVQTATALDDTAKIALQAKRQAALAEALLNQRIRRLMNLEMNLRPKFHALGLSNEQWERYEVLSLEKTSLEDEMRRKGGAGKSQEEFDTAAREAGSAIIDEIKTLIGASAYEELQRFQLERSDPVRLTINALSARLMFSNAPLEASQAEKLSRLLRAPLSATSPNADVQNVLTNEQLWAWKQIQRETPFSSITVGSTEGPKNAPAR